MSHFWKKCAKNFQIFSINGYIKCDFTKKTKTKTNFKKQQHQPEVLQLTSVTRCTSGTSVTGTSTYSASISTRLPASISAN